MVDFIILSTSDGIPTPANGDQSSGAFSPHVKNSNFLWVNPPVSRYLKSVFFTVWLNNECCFLTNKFHPPETAR
jgi:hypothetical protein